MSSQPDEGQRFPLQVVSVELTCGCSVQYDRLYVNLRSRTLQTLRSGDIPLNLKQMVALEDPNGRLIIRGTRTSKSFRAEDEGQPIVVVQLADAIDDGCPNTTEYVERRDDGVEILSRESWSRRGPDEIVREFHQQEIRRPGLRPVIVRWTPGRRKDDPR